MDLFLDRWALLKVRDYGIECEVRHASPGSARTPGRLGPTGSMVTSRTAHSNRPPPASETTERLGYRGKGVCPPSKRTGSGSTGLQEKCHCRQSNRKNKHAGDPGVPSLVGWIPELPQLLCKQL